MLSILMEVAPQVEAISMNILRPKSTAVKCGVTPITIHRWASNPKYAHMGFPKPIRLGGNSVGYIEDEVDSFLAERAAKRAGATEAA